MLKKYGNNPNYEMKNRKKLLEMPLIIPILMQNLHFYNG